MTGPQPPAIITAMRLPFTIFVQGDVIIKHCVFTAADIAMQVDWRRSHEG